MAKLRLTIGNISVSTEKGTATVSFETEISAKQNYNLSLVDFKFLKKMYQPTEVLAELNISAVSGNGEDWKPIAKESIEETFKNRRVKLEEVDTSDKVLDTIGDDYYVYEVQPYYKADSMVVTLNIYSPDHLMTLTKGCNAFVAKKLGNQILSEETKKYQLPYDTTTAENKTVAYSTANMKILNYKMTDGTPTEHIFPYLVQYNESFYDMLKRTTNRWGEFLFYENGKLNIGYDANESAKELTGWHGMKYCKVPNPLMTVDDIGTYDPEAAYDPNIIDRQLQKSPDKIINLASCDLENGLDIWMMKKIAAFLGNTKNIPSWLGTQATNEAWDTLVAYKNKDTVDDDFNSKYFNEKTVPEQWGLAKFDGEVKEGHNPFTELNTSYTSKKYVDILCKEQYAGQNAIQLDYDTTNPNLKLGQIVKVYGKEYIVVEVAAKVITETAYKTFKRSKTDSNSKTEESVEIEPVKMSKLVFQVMATAKNAVLDEVEKEDEDGKKVKVKEFVDFNFYPAMLSTGHIRMSEPQLAKVVDADDPLNQNRVRIIFSWQKADELPEEDAVNFASPWLVYATSAASKQNGIFGKHYPGDAVIVNFANGNVECPYVVGGLSSKGNKVPGSLAERDIVLSSPGGHTLRMEDGSGAKLTAFLSGIIFPGYEQMATFFPFTSAKDLFGEEVWGKELGTKDNLLKRFEGGFQLMDKYGVYSITGSTDGRNVSIKSPWGDVAISAFTGISISAPNGDIEIKGKNVTIEAGNNLELKSGTNVGYKLVKKKDTKGETASAFAADLTKPIASLLQDKLQAIDLSFIRNLVEVVMRPVEGALTVKSNRFLKLEAGKDECDYPVSAYKDQETVNEMRRETAENDLRPGLKLQASMVELLGKVSDVANAIDKEYRDLYNRCYDLLHGTDGLEKTIANGQTWVSGENRTAPYCNSFDQLKEKLCEDGEALLQDSDLGFKENYKVEGDGFDITDQHSWDAYHSSAEGQKNPEGLFDYFETPSNIIRLRKATRAKILESANLLRRAIIELRDMKPLKKMDVLHKMGKLRHNPPEGYREAMEKAFDKNSLGDVIYYQPVSDKLKKLETILNQADMLLDCRLLRRRASILMLEALGFKDEWRKKGDNNAEIPRPFEKEDILNADKWLAYVNSIVSVPKLSELELNTRAAILSAVGEYILDVGKTFVDLENAQAIWNSKGEIASWGEAKRGGILFTSKGNTYSLAENITEIEGAPKENLNTEDDADNDVIGFLNELRKKLRRI